MGEADFVPTESNQEALAWVKHWPQWPSHGLVLYGAAGSGKTHLAHIWAQRVQGVFMQDPADATLCARLVLDNIEPFLGHKEHEEALFHRLNRLAAQGGHILITAQCAPVLWAVQLPDLRSRLMALPTAHIAPPDDQALMVVIIKLFADRQLRVSMDVVDYLVRRIERSFSAAFMVVDACDKAALASGRGITLPLVREVLQSLDMAV